MKRTILLFTLCLALLPLAAQQFYGGIKGGLTFSQIDNDGFGGPNKIGLTAAVFTGRELSPGLAWQLEVKYVQRGMYDPPAFSGDDYYFTTYHYIEFPVSVNYTIKEKYMPEIGLSPDIFLKLIAVDSGDLVPVSEIETLHRLGINAFAGFHFWFSENTAVGLRFTYSALSFMDRDKTLIWPYNLGYFHSVFSLSVQHRFPFH